jgi:RecG-like helicase
MLRLQPWQGSHERKALAEAPRNAVSDRNDKTEQQEMQHRLATIEALLLELLDVTREKRSQKQKRTRANAHSAYVSAISDPNFKPTELQMAAARRALRRSSKR